MKNKWQKIQQPLPQNQENKKYSSRANSMRRVDTFEFEGLPETGHVTLETMKLEALPGGRTRLIAQSIFQSVADRDGMLQGGMEEGVNDTYDRLAELLKKL